MGTSIPASNNVVRYCPLGSLAGDRATGAAFQLHPGSATRRPDTYLSVYWLEFLGGEDRREQLDRLRAFIKGSPYKDPKLGAKGRLAVLNVARTITEVSPRLGGTGLTITHEPRGEKPKDPHSGIHGYGFNEVGEEIAAHLAEIASEQLYPAKV